MATITIEGRRVYIFTEYGEACVVALKSLGARWDKERRAWWTGITKRADVERIISTPPEKLARAAAWDKVQELQRDGNNLLGRGRYRDAPYYYVARGRNDRGEWLKLLSMDGTRSFFANAAEVEIVKEYRRPQTLEGLRAFAEKLKAEEDESLPVVEECWECGAVYRTYGNVEEGNMSCRRCG